MEQLVRIKQTYDNGTALVVHLRESACSGDCHKCSGCGAAKETVLLTADNPIGARRGDLVKVTSATAPYPDVMAISSAWSIVILLPARHGIVVVQVMSEMSSVQVQLSQSAMPSASPSL